MNKRARLTSIFFIHFYYFSDFHASCFPCLFNDKWKLSGTTPCLTFWQSNYRYLGGYIRHSGSYRIPVTGVYVITWVTPVVGNIPLELVINGQQRGRTAPASPKGEGKSQTTTGVAVLFLYRRDVVSIRTHPDFHPVGFIANNKWQDSCLSLWRI